MAGALTYLQSYIELHTHSTPDNNNNNNKDASPTAPKGAQATAGQRLEALMECVRAESVVALFTLLCGPQVKLQYFYSTC